VSGETLSLWKVFQHKISMELPWSIRTLDAMKFEMIMKTTARSSRLMPLKSLSVKVIEGRVRYGSASTKLMLMSWMACR